MRKTINSDVLHEIGTLKNKQKEDVLNYITHLKLIEELTRPSLKDRAMVEIRSALKESYSF